MNKKELSKSSSFRFSTVFALILGTCSVTSSYAAINPNDPYEGFNRVMFTFNDKLDQIILKPVARFYNAIMPKPLNQGVHNFYNNINTLPTIANDILQLHLYQTLSDTWRFTINTTVGIGGIFDVASRMGIEPYTNDFGLTLARYGYKNSNYLVLPFFGPSTPRDGIGLPVDYFAFSVYPYIQSDTTRYAVYGLGMVDRRAQLLKFETVLEEASFDKYVFVRDAYMQRREYQIKQNANLGFNGQNADSQESAGAHLASAENVTLEEADQEPELQASSGGIPVPVNAEGQTTVPAVGTTPAETANSALAPSPAGVVPAMPKAAAEKQSVNQ